MKPLFFMFLGAMIVVILTGCGAASRITAKWTGYDAICVDGVTYLQFTSGATVKVTPEGAPAGCK